MERNIFLDANCGTCIPKYKKRKVSARRDFPKGIGLKAAKINLKSISEINLDSRGVVAHELQNTCNSELKKCPNGLEADSSTPILCVPVFKIPSQPEKLTTGANILVKTLCQKFPPRRRISAFRSFPLNFQRKVSENTKDKHIKSRASFACTRLTHLGAENNNVNSNKSMKFSSVESEDRHLKAESIVSCKPDCLFTLNSDENLQGECQASNVQESNGMPCCSIGTSNELKLQHTEYASLVMTPESGNQIVASNRELVVYDVENYSSDRSIENEVPANAVHNEEKVLISENSNSNETTLDEVNGNVSRAAPTSIEIIDDCSVIEFPSKNSRNSVIVYALMAAQNCPNKAVNLRAPNGKKKNEANQIFNPRRASQTLSKRRRVSNILKASDPNVLVLEVEDDEKSSCEQDEESDGDNASLITHGVNLDPIVARDAVMYDDSDSCISHRIVGGNMLKEQAVDSGREEHQEGNMQTCKKNKMSVPVQPELASKSNVTKNSRRSNIRHGVCLHDISDGSEPIPIRAINTIDNQQPPSFKYVTRMVYPDWCRPLPLRGCNCTNGCSDSSECACAARNGGEIPFAGQGRVIELKPLIYECGPSCKCPPSCPNRVGQLGIRYRLEIFKTESRGWGVRSRNHIPIGGFICEYLGELLEDKQAEQRVGSDEYLFDIGSNITDQEDTDIVNDVRFTIDAKRFGNVGRFINHSCSPNLYAQDVLYDHENKRIPHVMFFAVEDIPPLQELSYDYNYHIGDVSDQNGNVKVKQCLCGSKKCNGRLY